MLIDGRTVPQGTVLETDLCVVGGGAAGITLARRLTGRGRDVLLLEAGGREHDDATQELMAGHLAGEPMRFFGTEPQLDFMRLRLLGGSTNHWGGWCHPLEAVDFEERPHIPHSGWPFGLDELLPYYEDAQVVCELGPFRYDAGFWADRGAGSAVLDTDRLETTVVQISPPTRFAEAYGDELRQAPDIDICLWANVVGLGMEGDRVASAEVAVLGGGRFEVRARTFVLAAGGIEVPRLLLASDRDRPGGIGNQHDLVGRYFAEHPHLDCRAIYTPAADDLRLYMIAGQPVGDVAEVDELTTIAALHPDAEASVEHALPGLTATFNVFAPPEEEPVVGVDDVAALVGTIEGRTAERAGIATFRGEQRPNPESRVRLTRDRDAVGMRRVEVDWRLTADDRDAWRRGIDLMADELARNGLGRVQTTLQGEHVADRPVDIGFHHMGTTRMHRDPRRGVVDEHCRVHGTDNLYVAGSAVFPTGGWANPTLTIVALALRLADHLATGAGR